MRSSARTCGTATTSMRCSTGCAATCRRTRTSGWTGSAAGICAEVTGMTAILATFPAFRIHDDDAGYRSGIEQVSLDDLSPGEVVIEAAWSSVNFKDALAGTGKGRILRRFPLVGGIDVAGHVVASTDKAFRE